MQREAQMSECCTPDRSELGTADPTHIGVRTLEPPPKSITPPRTMIASRQYRSRWARSARLQFRVMVKGRTCGRSVPYSIAPHAVTNAEFAEFVEATDYRTDAQRFRWSFVFGPSSPTISPIPAAWSRHLGGARCSAWTGVTPRDRRRPSTAATIIRSCTCRGEMLPPTAIGETSACPPRPSGKGRLAVVSSGCDFPWGDELVPDGRHNMNVFQGTFPTINTAADGYAGTAPVDAYEPNDFGLHQMTGNVWEWCADWFSPTYYASSPSLDPTGPATGVARVMRAARTCVTSRTAAISGQRGGTANTPDSSAGNVGFASPAKRLPADRQADPGSRRPRSRIELDLPVVPIHDDASGDVETEASALPDVFGGEERLEHAADQRCIDSVSGVGHLHDDFLVVSVCLDSQGSGAVHRVDRVDERFVHT